MEGTCDGDTPPGYRIDGRRVHCYLYDGEPPISEATAIADAEIDHPDDGDGDPAEADDGVDDQADDGQSTGASVTSGPEDTR
jgi:hypothetical protein